MSAAWAQRHLTDDSGPLIENLVMNPGSTPLILVAERTTAVVPNIANSQLYRKTFQIFFSFHVHDGHDLVVRDDIRELAIPGFNPLQCDVFLAILLFQCLKFHCNSNRIRLR